MKVETFEVATFQDSAQGLAIEGEMLSLIEELGLEGQKALASDAEGRTTVTMNPYRVITAREKRVFETLFPCKTLLSKYKDGIVPLRILQVAKHAGEWFPRIEVWHPEPGKVDPVLVGYDKEGWQAECYLLARWGEALTPFTELLKQAVSQTLSKLRKDLSRAKLELAQAESLLNQRDIDIEHLPTSIYVSA